MHKIRSGNDILIPDEVVGMTVMEGVSLLCAWRRHLGITQAEMDKPVGVSQLALKRWTTDRSDVMRPRVPSAAAMLQQAVPPTLPDAPVYCYPVATCTALLTPIDNPSRPNLSISRILPTY